MKYWFIIVLAGIAYTSWEIIKSYFPNYRWYRKFKSGIWFNYYVEEDDEINHHGEFIKTKIYYWSKEEPNSNIIKIENYKKL